MYFLDWLVCVCVTGSSFILSGSRKAQRYIQAQNETPPLLGPPLYKHSTTETGVSRSPRGESGISLSLSRDLYPKGSGLSDVGFLNLEGAPSEVSCFVDTKDFYMTDDEGVVHRLVGNPGHKALTCAYCKLLGNKTACGWHIKCYYRCSVCDVPLCNIKRDCFIQFHTKLKTQQIQTLLNPVCAMIQGLNSWQSSKMNTKHEWKERYNVIKSSYNINE